MLALIANKNIDAFKLKNGEGKVPFQILAEQLNKKDVKEQDKPSRELFELFKFFNDASYEDEKGNNPLHYVAMVGSYNNKYEEGCSLGAVLNKALSEDNLKNENEKGERPFDIALVTPDGMLKAELYLEVYRQITQQCLWPC